MGKPTKKPPQAPEETEKEENTPASQKTTCASAANASNQMLPLTRADMEAMLLKSEERIISTLAAQFSADRARIDSHDNAIQEIETSMNDMQSRLMQLEKTCTSLKKENETLRLRADALENNSRRNNIRITNLPETAEGPRPSTFLAECLKEIFGPDAFPTPLAIDRAHRINVRRGNPDAPRPFIARIHHYQNKELILKLAREKGRLVYRGTVIHIFPDYSPEVSRKRAAFSEVKSQLRSAGYSYRMFFPAKLQILDKHGQKITFSTPDEVKSFLASAEESP